MTWEQRLLRARRTGGFTTMDKFKVVKWPTCAIGEKFHVKTLSLPDYVPDDGKELGLSFLSAVQCDMVYKAVELYDQIQHLKRRA